MKPIKKKHSCKVIHQQPIARHSYSDFVVGLSIEIYTRCRCGFKSVVNLLQWLNEFLGWQLASIPCANTIENWVKKSGLFIYNAPAQQQTKQPYAAIVDESMMVGSQKLLLSLSVQADKEQLTALKQEEVSVIGLHVESSWNSEKITKVFDANATKMGEAPVYVISDNDSKISKAIREKNYIHVRDIGHSMAMFAERSYKNEEDFKSYMKALCDVKFQEVMTNKGYLVPPKQRSIARFMNLSASIHWSRQIQSAFSKLSEEEQKVFAFIHHHQSIIEELACLFSYINQVLSFIKSKGLSQKNIAHCLQLLESLPQQNERMNKCLSLIAGYLREESRKIVDTDCIWHGSSDIIESLFGVYKFRKASNPLHGVTPYVLVLPLLTRIGAGAQLSQVNFKEALEQIRMKDLDHWATETLIENQSVKRVKTLAA